MYRNTNQVGDNVSQMREKIKAALAPAKFDLSVWWNKTWTAHKNLILAAGGLVVALIAYFVFRKPKTRGRR